MKAAFDWKVRKNLAAGRGEIGTQVLHLEHAFHGRSGYTLSVTNTDPVKTLYYPKFAWPRIPSPAITFPLDGKNLERVIESRTRGDRARRARVRRASRRHRRDPDRADSGRRRRQPFPPEFLRELRRLADEREALLIYDEVQTGVGLTGEWWAYQHHGIAPDILCFAKKMQVGGIFASRRLDEVKDNVFALPSRINSTWGASLVDMVRCTRVLEIIVNERLVENAAARGRELHGGLGRRRAALSRTW